MPMLLSAAALSVYVYLEGGMTPAIAFTVLAVFNRLEYSVSVVPNIISQLQDTRVSIRRIQKHLNNPDKHRMTTAGLQVGFDHASIAWPSSEQGARKFRLQGINLCFPTEQLR